jgi:hypothetical protein
MDVSEDRSPQCSISFCSAATGDEHIQRIAYVNGTKLGMSYSNV